jgi:hypothetical protein
MSTATKKNVIKNEAELLKERAQVLELAFQHVESLLQTEATQASQFATCHADCSDFVRLSRLIRGAAPNDEQDVNTYWSAICTKYGWGDQVSKIKGEKIDPSLGTMRSMHRKGASLGVNFMLGWYAFREETIRKSPKGEGRGRGKLKTKAPEKGGASEGGDNAEAIQNAGTPLSEVVLIPAIYKALLDGRAGLDPVKREAFDQAIMAFATDYLKEARKPA